MSWFRRWWSSGGTPGAPAQDRPAHAAHAAPASAGTAAPDAPETPAPPAALALPWLLGFGTLAEAATSADEQAVLDRIDAVLATPVLPERLLPRAAHLIPQLIALLRQSDLPVAELTARIGRDAVLAAEVMRLSDSPYYRQQDPVRNLEQAVLRIGEWGLQQVIARVILKPIYQGTHGPWSTRATARHWDHAETLSRHAAALSEASGQPPFDAYLAGMLHGTGWVVALHLADGTRLAPDPAPSQAFADALEERVHRLFGQAAQPWDITPGFTRFAQAAYRHGRADQSHGLSPVLQAARQLCLQELAAR